MSKKASKNAFRQRNAGKHLPQADGFKLDHRTQLGGGELRTETYSPTKFENKHSNSVQMSARCRELGIDHTGMSRQRMWQKIMAAEGRCTQCGQPSGGASKCEPCSRKIKDQKAERVLELVRDDGGTLVFVRNKDGEEFYISREKFEVRS